MNDTESSLFIKNNVYQDSVAKQYKNWIYPKPIDDICDWKNTGNNLISCPKYFHFNYWPHEKYTGERNILIAGCGANEAAIIAYDNPNSKVTGIDISHESLKHQRYLKKRHNLKNLELKKLAIEDVSDLNQNFDYITSQGVLHHLENPEYGAQCLASQLNIDGVFSCMLYAKAGRAGVYMIQELLQLLEMKQTEHDLSLVKNILKTITPQHPAYTYVSTYNDISYDAGIVDSFLHTRDTAYSTDTVLEFIKNANMKLQSWTFQGNLDPIKYFPKNSNAYDFYMKCDEVLRWRLMELIDCGITKHHFTLAHKNKSEHLYKVHLDENNYLQAVPKAIVVACKVDRTQASMSLILQTATNISLFLDYHEALVYNFFDGKRTVSECIRLAKHNSKAGDFKVPTFDLIERLWRNNAILLGYPGD